MNRLKITTFFIVFTVSFILILPYPTHAYFTSSTTLSNLTIGFGDWTLPITSLVQLPQLITPTERVTNGTFQDGLNGWTTTGTVSTSNSVGKLGNTHSYGTHSIQQTITGKGTLFVSYAVNGNETPLLPIFSIAINNIPIVQSTQTDGETRTAIIPLTSDTNVVTISVHAQPLLVSAPIWAEISEITTAKLALGLHHTVQLTSNESNATPWYLLENINPQQYTLPFSLKLANEYGTLQYWSTDDLDNKEQPQSIAYIQEQVAPEIGDVSVETLVDNTRVISLPPSSSTCPTSYLTQPPDSPQTLSSLSPSFIPFIDGQQRAFLSQSTSANNTSLTLVATSCFQTPSPPKEILLL